MFKDLQDFLTPFVREIGIPEAWLSEVDFWIFLYTLSIGLLSAIVIYAFKCYNWIILKKKQRLLNHDLHPFYTRLEIDKATRYYIPTKYQDTAPSQAEEPSRSFIDSPKAELIPMMLDKGFVQDDHRYYLILADSGMGKTTFMINLYLAYKNQFSWKKKYDIRLLPLGHPQVLAEVEKIENPGTTILLLDALDEDVEAVKDYKKRLGEILSKTWKFREIVITCRTQFFPSEVEEPEKTGFSKYGTEGGQFKFWKKYISVLDNKDINRYLRKRFKFYQWKSRKKAKRIIRKSPSIMVRPMLLSHIHDLVNEKRKYEYTYQIYEVLVNKWIERESNKPEIEQKFESKEKFKNQLMEFSGKLAVNLYLNRELRQGRLSIHKDEKVESLSGFQLSDFEKNEWVWGSFDSRSRSLLNRDADGQYKFSHKSILEYFLAKKAFEDRGFLKKMNFQEMSGVTTFFEEMLFPTLEKTPGSFTINDLKSKIPLHSLGLGLVSLELIGSITISSLNSLPICLLKALRSSKLSSLVLFDQENLCVLYLFYMYQLELLELQEMIDRPSESGNLLDLQKRRERLSEVELPELQEQLAIGNFVERLKALKLQELLELRNQLNLWEWQKLPGIQKILSHEEQKTILPIALVFADEFIKECKALQKALPNVKIYY